MPNPINLDNISQMMAKQDAAKKMVSAQMQQVTNITYALMVALSKEQSPEAYRNIAQVALNSTPYLFEAMGFFEVKEQNGKPEEGSEN